MVSFLLTVINAQTWYCELMMMMIGDFLSSISCPFFPNRLFHVHLLLCPSCPGREEIVDRRLTRERVCSTIFVIEERLKKATNWYYANCQRPAESRTMSIHPKKDLIKYMKFFQRVILIKHEFLLLFKRRSLGISSPPQSSTPLISSIPIWSLFIYAITHCVCYSLIVGPSLLFVASSSSSDVGIL